MVRWHFVGVAGVGMSAVAQAALHSGYKVSGSDRYYDRGGGSGVLGILERMGIELYAQDGSGVLPGSDAVVVSTAIEDDNPDLVAAREAGVRVLHRSMALAELVKDRDCLAIAGTSGKSTVTGMVGWILEQVGLDPFVVNGAPLNNWRGSDAVGNVRSGSGVWVIEADESDRSLLNYAPMHAVITNMSADHFGLDETVVLFKEFASKVSGCVIGALAGCPYLDGVAPQVHASGSRFVFRDVEFDLAVPGRHNVEDALHATELCGVVGVTVEECAAALRGFRGVHRRLEVVGTPHGVTVIDDYGHNPAKVRAAWDAVAPFAEQTTVIWRPHGYGPLRSMLEDFSRVLADFSQDGGRVLLLPVYDAGGTADRSISSVDLAERIKSIGGEALAVPDYGAATETTVDGIQSGDAVIVMGARDPLLPELACGIVEELKKREDIP